MLAFWQMFSQCAQSAVLSIRLHLLRSGLTTLGIIIGVAAVISVVAIMQGLSAGIRGQLDDLGSDMTTLRAFTTPDQELLGFRNKLTDSDYDALLNKINDFEQITVAMPAFSMGLSVSYGRSSSQSQLIGAAPNYQHVIRIYPQLGRFILPQDDERRRRVAFIGPSLINKLQLPANPVGEFVLISGDWFRIIGVGEKRGSLFGFDQDNYIITPFQTAKALNGPDQLQVEISYRAKAGVDEQALQQQIRTVLRAKRGLASDAPDPFEFITAEKMKSQFNQVLNSVTLVAAGVVGISLLVGGIGVMNIMLVSVTERTREIGIVKALGATPQVILLQFLLEAVLLSLFGGLLGLLLGYGVAALLGALIPSLSDTVVPLWAVLLSLGFTTFIGVVFGLMPAVKAARLAPIDALRYE
ncbi:ABC transporter permease [Rheinheimera texasensis]|uniref:ABC transporter permease n=1 Tax=Rheinheimera texasensis TaxID=306205 RepID=UPI0032B17709